MNVLSLFDGMSVGLSALKKLGIPVENYFASEIDSYAIKIAKKNHPEIKHVGSVTDIVYTGKNWIDLLIGGSPCQGFSFAGEGLNFNDPRSRLFFEYARILKEIRKFNPDVLFLLENVMMLQEYQDIISKALGVKPIKINSALVSAQNRKRLYWTNISGITQPADRGILLRDILENHLDRGVIKDRGDKSQCLDASYYKGVDNHGQRTMVLTGGHVDKRNYDGFKPLDKAQSLDANYSKGIDNNGQRSCVLVGMIDGNGYDINRRVNAPEGKAPTLLSKSTGGQYPPKIILTDEQIERAKKNYDSKVWPTGKRTGKIPFPDSVDKKAKCLTSSATTGGRATTHIQEGREKIIEQVEQLTARDFSVSFQENGNIRPHRNDKKSSGISEVGTILHPDNKATTPIASHVPLTYNPEDYIIRKLTPIECERLQGLEDNYTEGVSNTQRYKMLGNGWQRDTIEHIFSFIPLK